VSTPLEGQQGQKTNTDKIQAAINQTAWDSTAVSFLLALGNHHYLGQKTQLSSSRVGR
jgi:hypothetical protein